MKKKSYVIALLLAIFMFAIAFDAQAKAVKVGIKWYKGADGNWYWIEHFTDDKTGFKFSKIWTNGQGPDIDGGHKVTGDNDGGSGTSTSTNNGTSVPIDYSQIIDFRVGTTSLEIKTAEDIKIDVVKLEDGTFVLSNLYFNTNNFYQTLIIPNLVSNKSYGILVYKTNGMPIYSQIFYLTGSGYYLEPNN